MRCTEVVAAGVPARRDSVVQRAGITAALLFFVAGCVTTAPAPSPAPAAAPATPPAAVVPARSSTAASPAAAPVAAAAAPSALAPGKKPPRYVQLGPPATPKNANELRLQFARRLVQAHPDTTYMGKPPQILMAIPVIEVELNADGSVRNIEVIRKPSTGDESIPVAIDAIRRAAPYGDVSKLPKPWKIVETFLFNDDLKFKPRTLDAR